MGPTFIVAGVPQFALVDGHGAAAAGAVAAVRVLLVGGDLAEVIPAGAR